MLDAQPAANAPARPPTVQPLPASPAIADTPGVRSKPAALLAAATALLPSLEAGRALDAKSLREAMSAAFGAGDAQGAWVWKDAYEAAEAAMVLFVQRYGRLMRREAGAGPGSAAAMLAMLETLAALEPSQTRRSEEQLALQQFPTPLPLAYAALQAAAIHPGDIVLEPSAGPGMLAVMAECALGKHASAALHLNEDCRRPRRVACRIVRARAGDPSQRRVHCRLSPGPASHRGVDEPAVFVKPRVQRIRHEADLRHLRSAFSMLPAGGRLVAITSAGCIPGDAAWSRAFERLDPPPRTVFSIAIDGRAYARRGTTFDTRLTVIDRDSANAQGVPVDARESVPTAAGLLAAVAANVPQRQAVVPIAAALVPAGDHAGSADRHTRSRNSHEGSGIKLVYDPYSIQPRPFSDAGSVDRPDRRPHAESKIMATLRAGVIAIILLFSNEGRADQNKEEWSGFYFAENIDPITDEVDWIVASTSTENAAIVIHCFEKHRELKKITLSLKDGSQVVSRPSTLLVQLRFNKNPHFDLDGSASGQRIYFFRTKDQTRLLDGFRKHELMIRLIPLAPVGSTGGGLDATRAAARPG